MPVCTHGFRPQEGFEDYCECGSHRAHHVVLPPEKSTPPKPAHIDTTAPVVTYVPTPSPIDTTGQELANQFCDEMIQNLRRNVPASIDTTQGDAEPCIDCCEPGSTKETIEEQKIPYGQTGVVLTAYVPVFTCTKCDMQWTDWRGEGIREKVVAAYLAQPKPAPQAEAQAIKRPYKFRHYEGEDGCYAAIDADKIMNAQQAKIDALEQQVSGSRRRESSASIAWNIWQKDALEHRAKVAELEEKLREGK